MIKKITIIILFVIPIYWCLLEVKKGSNLMESSALIPLDSILSLPKFDFNYIKSKTAKLEKDVGVNAEFCNDKNRMTEAFISAYLSSKKSVIGDIEDFDSENYDGFCFKEHKEFDTYNLFTFTYDNGTCCRTLYAVTSKKDSLEIINIGVLAFSGRESGWLGDKYGKWISDGVMAMTTVSYYDDDFVEENNNSRIDTTWSIIRINKDGFLEENVYKRVKYLEGRKIE